MKFLFQRPVSVPLYGLMLLGFVVPQMIAQPLLADEISNVSDIKECRAIVDKAERLLCYDTIADGGVFKQQQVEQAKIESFGSKESQPEHSVEQLTVTIVKVQKGANRVHYFQTSDGAVWKQTSGGSWKLKAPFEATIKAGVMSSFFLVAEGGKSTRVTRVR